MPRPLSAASDPPREALARRAARLAMAGHSCAPLLPALRRLTVRELLAGPAAAARRSIELGAALCALTEAAETAARRPPGWLCCTLPVRPLPAAVPPRLLQAAVLCVLRDALAGGGTAALALQAGADGMAQLVLRGEGRPADAPALLRQLVAAGGGCVLYTARPPFTALLRLPLRPDLPAQKNSRPAELLADRYGMLYQFLGPWSAGPDL